LNIAGCTTSFSTLRISSLLGQMSTYLDYTIGVKANRFDLEEPPRAGVVFDEVHGKFV